GGHRLPLARHTAVDALAFGGATVGPSHRRRRPHLVDEYQLLRVDVGQFRTELLPLLLDVWAAALVGATHLFLAGDLELAQGSPDGHPTTAQPLGQLLQSGIGLFLEQLAQALLAGLVQSRVVSAAVGPWGQQAGLAAQPHEGGYKRDPDPKAAGQLSQGALLVLDRLSHSLPQVHRIGAHESPPAMAHTPTVSLLVSDPTVNRSRAANGA